MDDYLSSPVSNWDLGTKPNLGDGQPALLGILGARIRRPGIRYNIIWVGEREWDGSFARALLISLSGLLAGNPTLRKQYLVLTLLVLYIGGLTDRIAKYRGL